MILYFLKIRNYNVLFPVNKLRSILPIPIFNVFLTQQFSFKLRSCFQKSCSFLALKFTLFTLFIIKGKTN